MKKILLIILILSSVFYIFFLITKTKKTDKSSNIDPIITNIEESSTSNTDSSLTLLGYNFSQITLTEKSNVRIFSNLDNKLTSKDAKSKYNCDYLVNGGFYTKDNKHVGLFISEGDTISNSISNNLFNGFLSITSQGKLYITNYPKTSSYFSTQSGPLLIFNQTKQSLNLGNDKNSRRIIALTTTIDQSLFLAIYDKNSPIKGPKLSELINLLKEFENLNNIIIKNALNLDGGSHSAFLSIDTNLSEISPVGSFICIN